MTLANFTLKPIDKLRLLVGDVPKVRRAVSAIHGPVSFQKTAEGLLIELPLDTVDIVTLHE